MAVKKRYIEVSHENPTFKKPSFSWQILIDKKHAEKWFAYIKKRNITVHAYQPEILDDLFANTAKEFLQDLDRKRSPTICSK